MIHLVLNEAKAIIGCASVLTERVAETVGRSVQVEFAGSLVDAVRRRRSGRRGVPLVPFGGGRDGVPLVPLAVFWHRGGRNGVPLVPLAVVRRL